MSTIGKIIKDARLSMGYTQEELASKVGVQKSAIAKWENGRVSEIKRSNLKALAEALELDPNTLLSPSDSDISQSSSSAPELELTEQEARLLVTFRRLNKSQQERLIAYAEGMLDAGAIYYDFAPAPSVKVTGGAAEYRCDVEQARRDAEEIVREEYKKAAEAKNLAK